PPPPQEVPLFSSFGRLSLRDAIAQTQASFTEFLQEGDAAWRVLEQLPNIPMTPREVRETIEIETPSGSQLMRISVTAAEPEVAALLANTIVKIGLEEYGILLAQPTASTRIFVEQELEVARAELQAAEEELTQFRINNTVGDLDDAMRNQNALIRSLKVEADRTRSEGNIVRVQSLEKIILEREAELQDFIGLSTRYNELNDKVARSRSTHNFLRDTLAEAQIKESQILQLGSVQVITEARPPRTPTAVISSRLIALGAIASLGIGVLLALFLEYLEISGVFGASRQEVRQGDMAVLTDRVG
ncbi:MAG: hypothetical protein AAF629_35005, partial [Chloroflexota bacterium]